MKLVATKSFSYSTRRLKPGDLFEAKDPDGRLLIGVRKARAFGDRIEDSVPAPKKQTLDRLFSGGVVPAPEKPVFVGESPSETVVVETEPAVKPESVIETNAPNDAKTIPSGEDAEAEEAPTEKVEEVSEAEVAKTPARPVNRRGRARKS